MKFRGILLSLVLLAATSLSAASRPNVVFLLADDLGYRDIGCYGGPVKTPVLDKLAAGGVRFTDFHSGAPGCSHSRASFLTGRHHYRAGVYSVITERLHKMHLLKSETTIAEVLKENGYATAHFGKWHLGMPVQNRENPTPADHGFDYWFGLVNGPGKSHKDPTNFIRNGERVGPMKGYSCQIVVDEALTWLDEKRDADEPFFLNLWFNEPHAPIAAPDEIVSQYGDLNDQAAIYSGTIDNTDRAIGRLVTRLKKLGELDNTIIVYSSDNGSYRQERNGELRGKKGSQFEGGHRVPGIFYWKGGIPGGRVEDEPAAAVDLLPTLCGLIGIDKPGGVHLDGSDLAPLLTRSDTFERHQPLFWISGANMVVRIGDHTLFASGTARSPIDSKTAKRLMEQIRGILGDDLEKGLDDKKLRDRLFSQNMKIANPEANRLRHQLRDLYYFNEVWIPELKKSQLGRVQLYDLSKDLGQQKDIAKESPEIVARMKKQAAAIYRSVMADAPEWPTPKEQAAAKKPNRPNILYIIVDDQSPFDFKFYNPRSQLDAPVIEKLAAQGMVIDGAYQMGSWVGGVCNASRRMIMSGRTVWHIPGSPFRKPPANRNARDPKLVPSDLAQSTLPAVFNRAGYDTMRTCKWENSYEAANKLFTVRNDATKRGGTADTGSAWHAERVLDYLSEREKTKDEDPFLIYFGFSHPHDPRNGTPELLKKYGAVNHRNKATLPPANPKQPNLPINYLPKHPFHHGHPGLRDAVKVPGVWERRDESTIRNEIGRQFACSEYIDQQIGRVLTKLKAMGELDNTYIVYTADHGMAIGRHGLQGKQNLYEHTWRVPFVVKGPGIKPGSRAQGNFYLLDTLATLCSLAGIKAPATNEGLSLKPVLMGREQTIRDTLYGVYSGGTKPGMRSVRRGDWKLIKYDVMDGTVRKTQLFNLKENPHEFIREHHALRKTAKPQPAAHNLAGNPKYAAKRKAMEALLLQEMKRHNDPYRLWDQPKQSKDKQPNVIVLLADDLGSKDLGCYGGPVKTPVLDGLAAKGVRFTDFHAGAAVCSPSRATLLTGRQNLRTGIYGVLQDHMHDMHLLEREVTIAEVLKKAGYGTAHFGKWHIGMTSGKRKKPSLQDHGFDYWFGLSNGANPSHRNPTNFMRNGKPVGPIKGYSCQIVVSDAINWLETKANPDQPFFMNIWFNEPHSKLAAPDDITSIYGDLKDEAAIYSATVDNTDRAIGRLVAKLKETGKLDNTLIIYSSDHGSYRADRNGGLKGNKGSNFQGGLRSPGIFFWPDGVRGGRIESTPSGAVDLLPTICGLAGIDKPKGVHLDGADLSPLLIEKGTFKRSQPMLWLAPSSGHLATLREGNYTLMGYRGYKLPANQAGKNELLQQMARLAGIDPSTPNLGSRVTNTTFSSPEYKRLKSEFVRLRTFQEAWIPAIKAGGFSRFALYDLKADPLQKKDISKQRPEVTNRLKKKLLTLYKDVMADAPDWPSK